MVNTQPEIAAEQKTLDDRSNFWRGEIEKAKRREKSYRKEARELIRIYEGDDEDIPYNILYSNTETLAPAVYNVPPRPDTRPRNKLEDPTAMAAAGLVDSYLTFFIDSGDPRYCSLDEAAKVAVAQALVPGRGVIRLHYRATVQEEQVTDESVFPEPWDWDKVLFGYAKSWGGMPWVGFIHVVTREEALGLFGAVADTFTYARDEDDQPKVQGEDNEPSTATVYEIWHKASRKVLLIEEAGWKIFQEKEDPFKLENFYPMPQPLQFFQRISAYLPVPLYRLYKKQAMELNKVTRRIDKLIDAIKVRGFYDSSVEGIIEVFRAEENTLVPIHNLANLGQGAKAENAVWLSPVEKHIQVLQQLFVDRQQIKVVIFEIMGIADIMRGQSAASETLGAQEIKNRWGTLRLKRAQGAVSSFLRDTLRIAAELAFTKLGPDTLRGATGSELPRAEQIAVLEAQAQAAVGGVGAAAPNPQLQQLMALPTFEECLALLKTDLPRRYTVDIETNSTVDAEATEDKSNLAEFLNALAQFLNGVAPLQASGLLDPNLLKVMLVAVTRRFRLGRDLDEAVKKLNVGGQPQGDVEAQKKQIADAQKKLAEGQKQIAQAQQQVQKEKASLEQSKIAFSIQQAQAQAQMAIAEAQASTKDAKQKASLESALLQINTAMEKMRAMAAIEAAKEKAEAASEGNEGED